MEIFEMVDDLIEQIDDDQSLRERDKDVLSVAIKELRRVYNRVITIEKSKNTNIYEDMNQYYIDKERQKKDKLKDTYLIVKELYIVAMKKEETLLQYLTKNKPYEIIQNRRC